MTNASGPLRARSTAPRSLVPTIEVELRRISEPVKR